MARSAASFVKPVPRRVVSTVSNTVPFRTETVENREKKESRVALFGKQKLLLEIINSPSKLDLKIFRFREDDRATRFIFQLRGEISIPTTLSEKRNDRG